MFVYIMTNKPDGTLYTGVTNDLVRRVHEHRAHLIKGFTDRYNLERLVWFEQHYAPAEAIRREKALKGWRRAWKVALIEKVNPGWRDMWDEIVGSSPTMTGGGRTLTGGGRTLTGGRTLKQERARVADKGTQP